ncbi:NUDIX domain-containing protein [Tepidibacillus infernus]|uniref:NTP pyrophosphohydrolase n=1 Tax=Tepidibacillus decaturensis TaxID=1413211 RepID=A0A135L2I0_9BACI|nr:MULTISPECIES: NUDIX domain-containing protein [Tepidibacillus]KXG43172.1 NTP pyrophosphohydrolase [Tepidibacillus decaturensis]GBF10131.1 diadenosine hexaphosphate hydrolase [Tepidibacillus sp. HK-1]
MKEVSAGGVVFFEADHHIELLLIQDRCQRWTLPKGKQEEGETFAETALREIAEETGIEGTIVKPLDKVYYEYYHPSNGKIEKEVHYYLVKTTSKELKVQVSEINAAEWFSLEEAWERQKISGYDNNLLVIKMALEELGFNQFSQEE